MVKFCVNCGASLTNNAKFCGKCGMEVITKGTSIVPSKNSSYNKESFGTKILSKLPLWIFTIFMIYFLYSCISNPAQFNYWLGKNGFLLLILELLSGLIIIFLLALLNRNAAKKLGITVRFMGREIDYSNSSFPKNKYRIIFLVPIVSLIITSLIFSAIVDIWLSLFFIITISMKFLNLRRIKSIEEINLVRKSFLITIYSWFFSSIPAVFVFKSANDGFLYIGIWGILYYAFFVIFDLLYDPFIKFKRKIVSI